MIAFDTHQYVKELKAAGFTEAQAEIQANWLKVLVENDLATKQDVHELELKLNARIEMVKTELKHDIEITKAELQRDIKALDAKIEASKVELLKWLIGLMIAQTGVIIAIVKLLPNVG